jgi:DNA invertase Pin-like site-specific DNA recombinase
MNGAVGYLRVSTLEQAALNNSLPVQQSKFTTHCARSSLTPLESFVDKQSGRNVERPAFQRMLAYCRKNKSRVRCVVVADLSRLARNVVDQGQTIAELGKIGIRLVSVDEPNIDGTAAGKLATNILGAFNQFFSDSLSEKTRFRMQAGREAGRWLWVAPLGYLNDTTTKRVVIDTDRAPLVTKAFELLRDGTSIGDVIRSVTALGLRTRKGRTIPKQTFSRIVRNPFYAGWIQNGDTRVRGAHDALVSDDLFERVQARLKGHIPHAAESEDFPLRGFVRCARCGKNLTAGWVTGRTQKYPRYWCWTKGCRAVGVRAERLEGSFRTLLGVIQPEAHLLASLPTLAARSWEQRKERIALDAKMLARRLQDQTTLNERTVKAKVMGELSDEDFKTMKASIAQETQRAQAQIAALDAESSSMSALVKQTDEAVINFRKSWESAAVARKREIQTALFPEGLAYDPEIFYFCPQNPSLVTFLSDILESMGVSVNDDKTVGVPTLTQFAPLARMLVFIDRFTRPARDVPSLP